ncbi:redox-regulated ATPase YchF [Candidatus Aciduliprofundum boonei]|uniref:Uncharacterized protein n=1 Tax=Aciduliprofundum boonei (strain DSM 19572 / T469) TaxID=439481 RepID=B5IA16_ACIB4|nr:redox-regulated ATPase YchF [Candidatus Aciduliprofundum boonei]ADD08349.1 GTPase of unknown function domain protein [Aciduliprofundum boonei T469]EDY36704.1 GTPase, putative [Aciduliprofundum boonei T469]HII54693.1 redox-regulated ATPase YchF [Candidatus Aciduliprofundum boonei]
MVELGIVGKPNVGKSTFFAAATLQTVEIGNYPFTTIEANRAIGYVRKPCPHLDLGKQCNPKKSLCIEGTRYIPVELIDVAGLVPEAHAGRGLGNKFLDDLRHADALIHIIDVSGSTDAEGNPVPKGSRDPCKDVDFLDKEIAYWIADIIGRGWTRIARRLEAEKVKIEVAIAERLSGLNINDKQVHAALSHLNLDEKPSRWKEEDILALSFEIRRIAKPMVIAANKADITDEEYLNKFLQRCREKGYDVIPISADYELALRRAAKAGFVDYKPGDEDFKILKEDELSAAQLKALEKIREFMHKFGGTGVQRVIEHTVFNVLQMIAVYPVEDEHKWTDKDGNVLPDVYLFPLGSTALDLAYKVHTDLGENFIRAVDGRSKKILGHDYELKDGDVIKIIARR